MSRSLVSRSLVSRLTVSPFEGNELLDADRAARRDMRRAVDDLADAERAAGIRPRIGRWFWALLAVAVIVAVLGAGFAVSEWVRSTHVPSDVDYERAATRTVELLLSPNHTEPQQVRQILDSATGSFYDEFAQSAQAYTEFVRRNGTVAAATIDGAGVERRADDSATVLVAATVTYLRAGQESSSRVMRLRLLVVGDRSDGDRSDGDRSDGDRSGGDVTDSGGLKVSAVQYLP